MEANDAARFVGQLTALSAIAKHVSLADGLLEEVNGSRLLIGKDTARPNDRTRAAQMISMISVALLQGYGEELYEHMKGLVKERTLKQIEELRNGRRA